MTDAQRYWEPSDLCVSDRVKDWVSENVLEALTQLMNEGVAWLSHEDGKLKIVFASFEMPQKEGELEDAWHKEFDLLEMAIKFADDHKLFPHISVEGREEQRIELLTVAAIIDDLAVKFRERVGLPPRA